MSWGEIPEDGQVVDQWGHRTGEIWMNWTDKKLLEDILQRMEHLAEEESDEASEKLLGKWDKQWKEGKL